MSSVLTSRSIEIINENGNLLLEDMLFVDFLLLYVLYPMTLKKISANVNVAVIN